MQRIIAIDTETRPFETGYLAPHVICLSVFQDGEARLYGPADLETQICTLLEGDALLVGHYIAYDFACIAATFPALKDLIFAAYQANRITCTMNREKLLDIAEGIFRAAMVDSEGGKHKSEYSLARLSKKYLNVDLNKGSESWRLHFSELEKVPIAEWPSAAREYALDDARSTFRVYEKQEKRAKALWYNLPTQFEDSRADYALRLMSVWGICTDTQAIEKLKADLLLEMERLSKLLVACGLASWVKPQNQLNLLGETPSYEIKKNMLTIKELVSTRLADPPRTPKGKIRTDAETLEACDSEELRDLIQYNQIQKMVNTYLNNLKPLIHAHYVAVAAASDRTSCDSPNLQNLPRAPGVRECFVPRKGYRFLACDFDAQEMRTLAQSCIDLTGRSELAKAFQKNRHFDPHLEFGKLLAKTAGHGTAQEFRQRAKAANFGFPAGLGADKFSKYAESYGIQIDSTQAQKIKALWFEAWPEMREYFHRINALLGEAGIADITIPQSGFIRANCRYSEAANTYFQTLAAHSSKSALWEICRRCYTEKGSWLYGARPVLFIHDEIIIEVLEEIAVKAAIEMKQVLIAAQEKWTPDIPAEASATLMEKWSKKNGVPIGD